MSDQPDETQVLLQTILQRLDQLDERTAPLGHLLERLPILADAVGTTATTAWAKAETEGIDPVVSLQELQGIAWLAARPEQLETLRQLVQLAPKLQPFLQHPDLLVRLGEMLTQIPAEDLDALLTRFSEAAPAIASHAASQEFEDFVDAWLRHDASLKLASAAGTALVEAQAEPIQPAGAFGAFFRMGDPDIQRALGLMLAIAKRFGRKLR